MLGWVGTLPPDQISAMLLRHFFPKWLAALQSWLAQAADYGEVSRWYVEIAVHIVSRRVLPTTAGTFFP